MKPLLLVTGPPATRSGYGAHTRDLIHSLIDMDEYDIKVRAIGNGCSLSPPWATLRTCDILLS